MKKTLTLTLVLIVALSTASFAAISVKGGLAGGGGRIAVATDLRQIRPDVGLSGELGYAIGNSYSETVLSDTIPAWVWWPKPVLWLECS